MLNPNYIKKKSKELNIGFDNLLLGCCLEEILVFLAENHKESLWVNNGSVLGLDSYRRRFRDTLVLTKSSKEEDLDTFVRMVSMSVASHYMNQGIRVTTSFLSDNRVQFLLDIERMKIPIMMVIQDLGDIHTFPKEKELELTLQNGKTVSFLEYPLEEQVAQLTYNILDKLELLNEMEYYIELYDLISTEAIEGRKVKECLSSKCVDKKGYDLARLEKLGTYRDYTYMKKKWKRVVRQAKRDDLNWQQVHELIMTFIEPIYTAMVKDEVFFGDWMPNIARFLD